MDIRLKQVPIQQTAQISNKSLKQTQHNKLDFKDILQAKEQLHISKHAASRMNERNIHLNDYQLEQLSEKMLEASKKDVKESVVFTKDAALIVSVKNNTIITAMNRDEAETQIFSNIDGAILLT